MQDQQELFAHLEQANWQNLRIGDFTKIPDHVWEAAINRNNKSKEIKDTLMKR